MPTTLRLAALTFLLCMGVAKAAPSPQDFVSDAIKGDNSEIMLGRYAETHGGSRAIRQYGHTLVADHTKAKQQMMDLAHSLHVKAPSSPLMEALAERTKLIVLKGHDFDREFANYMVKDHQDDIAKFKAQADDRAGPASAMAAKQLSTLEKHLRIAQSLAG